MPKRHPENASGDWYVDDACIDCGAARDVAPGLIVSRRGQSVFARQPRTPDEIVQAWRARLLCPTASVRTERAARASRDVFPEALAPDIFRLGYNARASYGAHSFLIRRPGGNAMVDSPRWTKPVVAQLEAWDGLSDVLLSHRDDVADAARYARHFGARVWIHQWDRMAAPFADSVISGREPFRIAEDLLAIPVPGHTKGSTAYLYGGRALFTGDSLAWDFEAGDLTAWRDVCWYSWEEQTRSLERLLDYSFEYVLAGHGGSQHRPATEMRARLSALVARMKTGEGAFAVR
jgi:glyoxylase-like metal-dependent hydrolase (beta-lactamase superfamily II)